MAETIFTEPAIFPQAKMATYNCTPIYSEPQTNCWHQEDYHDGYPNNCNPYWHKEGRCCEHGCRLCYDKPWNSVPIGDGIIPMTILLLAYSLYKYLKK